MRSKPLLCLPARVGSAASVVVVLAALGCQGSSTVSGPSTGTSSTSSVNVSGSWSGSFLPNDSVRCNGSAATAVFQQSGNDITGSISTSECGVTGYFRGNMLGSLMVGKVSMEGCTGGGVSGTVDGSQLSLSIGDLTKPLVTGDKPVMTGGTVNLHR
jgi:hypothetical protein